MTFNSNRNIIKQKKRMLKKMLKLIGIIIACIGVIFVYDARPLAQKYFDVFGEENQVTEGLKIIGCVLSIIGGIICMFNI